MNQHEEKYFENYFEMFATKGWHQFIHDIKEGMDDSQKKAFDGSEENFWMVKGGISCAEKVINFETILRSNYGQMEEDEQEEEEMNS